MLLAYTRVKFDFKLLQKAGRRSRMLRHDLIGKNRIELDVELAKHRLELIRMSKINECHLRKLNITLAAIHKSTRKQR